MRPAREVECEAITAEPDTSVIDVADLLDAHAVGCIVIVDQDRRPQGMVTDRDLMSRVIAAGRDPAKTTAGDIMTTPVVKGSSDETIQELLTRMEEQGVRRIALVEDGRLTALLALDDLVMALSSQLYNVSESVWVALREARRSSRARRRHEAREEVIEELRHELGRLGGAARDATLDRIHGVIDRLSSRSD